jgi:hypothetical protein
MGLHHRSGQVGRAVPCPPSLANQRIQVHHDGAHGVSRPTFRHSVLDFQLLQIPARQGGLPLRRFSIHLTGVARVIRPKSHDSAVCWLKTCFLIKTTFCRSTKSFRKTFAKYGIYNSLPKDEFHRIAEQVSPDEADQDVKTMLDQIVKALTPA